MSIQGVEDVHHMHAWSLSEEEKMMTFHALINRGANSDHLLEQMLELLEQKHGVGHATIQIEVNNCQFGDEACR